MQAIVTKQTTVRDIVRRIAAEYRDGLHQREIKDLPWEIQFRAQCNWGRALSYANDIRVGKIR